MWLAIKKGMGNLINLMNKAFEKLNKARNNMAKGLNVLLPKKYELQTTQKIEIDNPFDDELKADFKGLFDNAFKYNERFTELQDRQFGQGLNQALTGYSQSIIDGRKAREEENKALFDHTDKLHDISGSLDDITGSLNKVGKSLKSDTEKYFDSMKSETQKYIEKLPEINALKDKGDYKKAWEMEDKFDMSKIDWRLFEKMSKPEQLQVDYGKLEELIQQELTGQTDANTAIQSNTDALTANTNALNQIATMQETIRQPENNQTMQMQGTQTSGGGEQVVVGLRLEKDNEKLAGQVIATKQMADALQRFFNDTIRAAAIAAG